jgi:hypothetical protein
VYRILALALSVGLVACAPESVSDVDLGLAVAGNWSLPPGTNVIGDQQHVEYDSAPAWTGTDSCAGGLRPGARALQAYLSTHFTDISKIGGYSCRQNTADATKMSVHGTGRALDVVIPKSGDTADNDLGDPLANWLVENAERIGVQLIIWDRTGWHGSRDPGEKARDYTGPSPHTDHIHFEITERAADELTEFFESEQAAPDLAPCGVIPPNGGLIDNDHPCLTLHGTPEYWHEQEGSGFGSSLVWTNAFESDEVGNWARWKLEFIEAGHYRVEAYVGSEFAVFADTPYVVQHADGETNMVADQRDAADWLDLGSYEFEARGEVIVGDNSPNAVAADQHIAVDALRLTRLDEDGVPWPGGGAGSGDDDQRPGVAGGCNAGSTTSPTPFGLLILLIMLALKVRATIRSCVPLCGRCTEAGDPPRQIPHHAANRHWRNGRSVRGHR